MEYVCPASIILQGFIIPSVIVVHGLGQNHPQTWTKDDRMWLKDFLPSDFPFVGVLAFVYPPETSADGDLRSPATSAISLLRADVNERADLYLKVRRCLLAACVLAPNR